MVLYLYIFHTLHIPENEGSPNLKCFNELNPAPYTYTQKSGIIIDDHKIVPFSLYFPVLPHHHFCIYMLDGIIYKFIYKTKE